MKKLMIIVALLGFSVMVFAQPKEILTPKEKALLVTDKMKTEALISEEQFDKVYDINVKTAERKQQIREEMKKKMAEYRGQMKQVEADRMVAYESVLDENQVREIKIAKARKKAKMMKRGKMRIERPKSRFDQKVPRSVSPQPQK